MPCLQVFGGVGVVDGEHGEGVGFGFEAVDRLSAHALRGAGGVELLGVLFFEGDQFAHQLVVFRVGHQRFGIDEVGPVGAVEKIAQSLDAGERAERGHGGHCIWSCPSYLFQASEIRRWDRRLLRRR